MVEKLPFGDSFLYRITDGPFQAEIIPYGAVLRTLVVPDRNGKSVDVVLGYDSVEEYKTQDACLGAIVGRYANRISGAGFTLNDKAYTLTPNEGPNTLHSAAAGFHLREWDLRPEGENAVVCSLLSKDGDGGFPGSLELKVTYRLEKGALSIHYAARCDADTPLNLTNHSYFNLAGQGSGTVEDHLISFAAQRFTPADGANIPIGELRSVEGTAWDLRKPVLLGDRLAAPELAATRGFDQNFALDAQKDAATVYCPKTGIRMVMDTDMEGTQLYTAGWLSPRKGKAGAGYDASYGLCLESGHYPNAVNTPTFPSPILPANTDWESTTTYRFTVE